LKKAAPETLYLSNGRALKSYWIVYSPSYQDEGLALSPTGLDAARWVPEIGDLAEKSANIADASPSFLGGQYGHGSRTHHQNQPPQLAPHGSSRNNGPHRAVCGRGRHSHWDPAWANDSRGS